MGQAFSGTMGWESAPQLDQSKDFTVFILGVAPNPIGGLIVAASVNAGPTRFWGGANSDNNGYFSGGSGDKSAGPLTPGQPFDICGVYSGGNVTTYNAGLLVTAPVAQTISAASGPLTIMAYGTGGFNWTGQLNMVVVWQRALTATEIFAMHLDPFGILELPEDAIASDFGVIAAGGTFNPGWASGATRTIGMGVF